MTRSALRLISLVLAGSVVTAYSGQIGVSETPVLPPEAAMKTFSLPAGYHVELVAAEPLIQDPVLIDWDPDGRMWVVEMPSYMIDIRGTDEQAPTGRVVVLEDVNNDGRMDRRTVFADGLVLPRALKVLDRGVLVGEPPNLWLMRDTNGDLRADTKTLVTDRYGRRDANVEHNANSLLWALDNWIYTSEVAMFLRLRNGAFEVASTLSRGQWGGSQDDTGRVYRNTNSSVLHVDLVPTQYYARHSGLLRTRGSYESLAGPDDELNVVWPARPTRGVNRGYQAGVLRPDGTLARYTGVAAPTVYRGDRLPPDVYGNVFVVEPAGNLVSRIVLADDGTSLSARKADAATEFFTSTDERFRPVYLSSAPDGTLYVVDMYRGIIQHRGYITEYLRDQILSRKLEQPIARGRIYRVVHRTTRRGPRPALSRARPADLVRTLSHPNGWWRDTAQQLIVERGDRSVVRSLEKLAASDSSERTRLHALWSLDGLDSLAASTVERALADASPHVRRSAVRLAERWMAEPSSPVRASVLQRTNDASPAVRRQLAASLGWLPEGPRETALAALLAQHGDDPIVVDAAISGLSGRELSVFDLVSQSSHDTPARRAALTVLAATIVRSGEDGAVQNLFDRASNRTEPEWLREAILGGAEVALADATMPGSPGRRGGAPAAEPPCDTCPGGRAGPGGAAAFPGPAAPATTGAAGGPSGRGGRGATIRLTLTRPPSLVELAARSEGESSQRASKLVARIGWPGKQGAPAPPAPLSAAQKERFEAGEEIYQNLCQACHQADGRGMEKVTPPLIGSELALGPAGVAIRIVLQGKEGAVGLMPPLGGLLNDDQIAAALTYIRRAWGQTGTPVEPATVKQIRGVTASRTTPWTPKELQELREN